MLIRCIQSNIVTLIPSTYRLDNFESTYMYGLFREYRSSNIDIYVRHGTLLYGWSKTRQGKKNAEVAILTHRCEKGASPDCSLIV